MLPFQPRRFQLQCEPTFACVYTLAMKAYLRVSGLLLPFLLTVVPVNAKTPKAVSAKRFHSAAQAALTAMKARAGELKIQGVAVVTFAPGDAVEGWMSEMAVVGHFTQPSTEDAGNNLLGIAYAKAAAAANTLKDSGTSDQKPMTGEFGWKGGVVATTASGIIIVAFSGGKQSEDAATARVGLELLKDRL